MTASAYACRELPLSDAPRQSRRMPLFEVLTGSVYCGTFQVTYGYVVNLHGQGTYDRAKELTGDTSLSLWREHANEHDENAVQVYIGGDGGNVFLGYLDRETAAVVAREMDKGARLTARPEGRPLSGKPNRGGSLEIRIEEL
jgi:hypothetical protein